MPFEHGTNDTDIREDSSQYIAGKVLNNKTDIRLIYPIIILV